MSELTPERREIFDRLAAQTKNTPLYELKYIPVPRRCRIFCKEEYRHPTGSHYDRQTIALLRGKIEDFNQIDDENRAKLLLVETTTGSSGASFAWMCRVLDYRCLVFIPEDMPGARIAQIESYEAVVKKSPAGQYIRGLVNRYRQYDDEGHADAILTNHSQDTRYGPRAAGEAAQEVLEVLRRKHGISRPDYVIAALGNGISAHGMGKVFKRHGAHVVGMEPYESPDVLERFFPEVFTTRYPDGRKSPHHEIYGTGPGPNPGIDFKNIPPLKEILSEIRSPVQREWVDALHQLHDVEGKHVGNSSAGCLWAALDLARDEAVPEGSVIVTVFYDAAWRYLPLTAQRDLAKR